MEDLWTSFFSPSLFANRREVDNHKIFAFSIFKNAVVYNQNWNLIRTNIITQEKEGKLPVAGTYSFSSDSDLWILMSQTLYLLCCYCEGTKQEWKCLKVFFERDLHLSFIAELVKWQIIIIFSLSSKMLQWILLSDRRIEKLEGKWKGESKL